MENNINKNIKEPLVLTFDVGTQSTRVLLVNKHGDIKGFGKCNYDKPYYSKESDYAEQYPTFYFDQMNAAMQELKASSSDLFANIIAVTVTTIRDTVLCLDKNLQPLRDIIVWLDKREANPEDLPELPLIKKILFNLAGVVDVVNMQQRQSACNWIMTKEKDVWEHTYKFVMLSTYLNYLLTGKLIDSTANQIGHFPFDYKNAKWMNKSGLTRCLFDIPTEKLCDLIYPGETLGTIKKELAELWGIKDNLPLIATGSDKSCETLGLSVITKDKCALSFGTTATIQFTNSKYFEPQPHCPAYPSVIKDCYNMEVQIYRGYWMLSWFKKEFAEKEVLEADRLKLPYAEVLLNEHLKEINPGCDGLILHPFWAPGVANPNARGSIVGFRDIHTKYHIYKAIIEGINFGLMDGLYTMEKRGHQHIKEIYVGGGGSQSDEILQITANMFNLPVKRIQTHESCGLGASAIAFVAMHEFRNVEEAVSSMIRCKDTFYPEEKEAKYYANLYKNVYKKMEKKLNAVYLNIKGAKNYE